MVKNILLDLDQTLFDFKKAEANAISKTMQKLGVTPTAFLISRYSEINDGMWKMLERGEITRDRLLVKRFEVFFDEQGVAADHNETRAFYEKTLGQGHFFMDGAEELLDALYKKYRLYLVSNGTASVQKGRLESSGIEKYFDGIFISQTVGFNKPDVRFFEKVFESIPDFKKEETVIIGDSLTSDIQGGINAGIKTVWFAEGKENSELPDITVRSLYEIINIFENC